jgi:hypothetical protein
LLPELQVGAEQAHLGIDLAQAEGLGGFFHPQRTLSHLQAPSKRLPSVLQACCKRVASQELAHYYGILNLRYRSNALVTR